MCIQIHTPNVMRSLSTGLAAAVMLISAFSAPAIAQCCIQPEYESSAVVGRWFVTITAFRQEVWDNYGSDLNGLVVSEGTITPGQNGCYYTGAPFPSTSSVSGGTWTIGLNDPSFSGTVGYNQWGIDFDGDSTSLISTIREHASLPCTDHIPQVMYSQTSCNAAVAYLYFQNTQTVTIAAGTVTNCRAGVCDTISY